MKHFFIAAMLAALTAVLPAHADDKIFDACDAARWLKQASGHEVLVEAETGSCWTGIVPCTEVTGKSESVELGSDEAAGLELESKFTDKLRRVFYARATGVDTVACRVCTAGTNGECHEWEGRVTLVTTFSQD